MLLTYEERLARFGEDGCPRIVQKVFYPHAVGNTQHGIGHRHWCIYIGHGVGSNGIAAIDICVPVLMHFTGPGQCSVSEVL